MVTYSLSSVAKKIYERAEEIILIIKIEVTWVLVSSNALKPRIKIRLIEKATNPKLKADST